MEMDRGYIGRRVDISRRLSVESPSESVELSPGGKPDVLAVYMAPDGSITCNGYWKHSRRVLENMEMTEEEKSQVRGILLETRDNVMILERR